MRKLTIAAALISTAMASPAMARDGAIYVGIDAGLLRPQRLDLEMTSSTATLENALRVHHKLGVDADLVAGYDFGRFRLEGELGYKYAKLNGVDVSSAALAQVLTPGVIPGLLASDGNSRVASAMLNGLVDVGPNDGLNLSFGLGVGDAEA
ncbi:MAG: OmpA family protein, partial [Sphingomicrobium sp.]